MTGNTHHITYLRTSCVHLQVEPCLFTLIRTNFRVNLSNSTLLYLNKQKLIHLQRIRLKHLLTSKSLRHVFRPPLSSRLCVHFGLLLTSMLNSFTILTGSSGFWKSMRPVCRQTSLCLSRLRISTYRSSMLPNPTKNFIINQRSKTTVR